MAEGPQGDAEKRADAARLRNLEDRLSELTPKPKADQPMASHDQAHIAWRMVLELVVGLGLGFGIGYALDYLLGTTPFLMILFIFIGFAAGIKTMLSSAAELNKPSGPAPDKDKRD